MYRLQSSLLDCYEKIKKPVKTPLSYMGSKSAAVKQILALIPRDIGTLVSPFLGGGSVEVAVANCDTPVYGFDLYKPLVSCWRMMLYRKDELIKKLLEYRPVTRANYRTLLGLISGDAKSQLEEGAAYLALNKSTFMAQIWAGISTNPSTNITDGFLKRLENFALNDFEVDCSHFENVIEDAKGSGFFYLDPPYYVAKGTNYYGKKGNLGDFDHQRLSELLHQRDGWVLSYDNVEPVRELYKDYRQLKVQWKYQNASGTYTPAEPKEIIIVSNDIPIIYSDEVNT